jgi:hypothetical protein
MANWYGSSRSNYFRVKDGDVFLKWAEERGLGVFKNKEEAGLFAIHGGESTDDGSWPSFDVEGDTEIDLVTELAQHLAKRQIAVLLEVGAEKLRYLDDANQKRWVLKFNNAKIISQIDAVFVTVEPEGGSTKPSGKPLLFTSLRIDPNHP